MLHVAFVRSVHAHARIRGVDTGAATAWPGGAAVNVLLSRRFESGEVEKALAESAVVIERAFRTNRQSAAPLEGRGGVAEWSAGEGKLTLWSGTQVPHLARHGLAEILGLAENRIRVIAPDVGGGFGVKAILYPEDVALCLLAMRLGRAGDHVRDGARARARRRGARPRSRRSQTAQPGRTRRPALHLGHAPRARQPDLSRVLREGPRGDRL